MCLTPRGYTVVSACRIGLLPEVEMEVVREGKLAIEHFYGEWDGAYSLTVLPSCCSSKFNL